MALSAPYYPIVYVRGYAATMDEIEDTVADPYMGFNLGATKIRQRHQGEIVRFIFESPLVRLMKDEGYVDAYLDGDFIRDRACPPKSVWVFRYYEPVSETFGHGGRTTVEGFAVELRRFILRVRRQVCGDDPELLRDFKVHLVAHSMGGLICRSYLQKVCRQGSGDPVRDRELELPGGHWVDKVFTYATPHNGIEFQGFNVPDLALTRWLRAEAFNREVMADYLGLPRADGGAPARVDGLDGAFPPERFFCLVGTNYRDYSAFFGLSQKGTGPMSDGLVMIRNAAVRGAPRAFVHRSHSGHFGIVNSEEGYQNLRRFLFGGLRVELDLEAERITLPPAVQRKKDAGQDVEAGYYIETSANVRGANYFLHERRFDQSSAILRSYDQLVHGAGPVRLLTTYLHRKAKTPGSRDRALAFQVRVAIQVPVYEVERAFWFDEHFHGDYLLEETITFFLRETADGINASYGLASRQGVRRATLRVEEGADDGQALTFAIPLGFRGARAPAPGFRGRLLVRARGWD